ncbi:unnamed protein product [Ilex paraguariensis]|uniref:Uracil phosphoribosyltransferase n=1 Tax=Ilex paraguariensis TaxID=185542 RepID=A0ABC8UWN6_9AQUA
MACRKNLPLLRYPYDPPLFSAVHRQHLPVPNLIPSSLHSKKISLSTGRHCRSFCVKSEATTEKKPIAEDRMLVFVPPHPLIKHWVAVLRNEQTPCTIFIKNDPFAKILHGYHSVLVPSNLVQA